MSNVLISRTGPILSSGRRGIGAITVTLKLVVR
jgi:hypothetical protein